MSQHNLPNDRGRAINTGDVLAWLLLSVLGVFWLMPFLWMLSSSLKSLAEIYSFPPNLLPEQLQWWNYIDAWNAVPFARFFVNSVIVSVGTTAGVLLTSSMAGYSFSRLRYPGRDKLFLAYLATMMVPFPVLIIPLFILMGRVGLVDTLIGLILPAAFSAWGTFLMRQFMLSIPREVEEAARVDGASYWRIYAQIILPLCKPVIATLGIFTFLGSWNEFLWPLIMISSVQNKTLPLGLTMFQGQAAVETPWQLVMAAATFSILPVLVLFVLGQKYYVRGIATTGVKG
ncbi:MAG: carbohydrate ABC transporter permease [Thermomicrobiales bacterium]|nr:carbohydrate ABC transporter permease [Thermomicrobiales bacterium]